MVFRPSNGIRQVLADFAAAIHGGPNPNSPAEALADLAVIEAMLRSAASGRMERIRRFSS